MANKARVKQVIEAIEADPDSFDMFDWVNERFDTNHNVCGTTLCVAGHAMVLSGAEVRRTDLGYLGFFVGGKQVNPNDGARKWLELTDDEFFDGGEEVGLFYCENDEALNRLKALAED